VRITTRKTRKTTTTTDKHFKMKILRILCNNVCPCPAINNLPLPCPLDKDLRSSPLPGHILLLEPLPSKITQNNKKRLKTEKQNKTTTK
jgi:hypothetical protein